MTTQELAQRILERIETTEQDISTQLAMLGPDTHGIRSAIGMNALAVLKNDIKQLCQEELNKQ